MTYYVITCIEGRQLNHEIAVHDPEDAAAVVLALAKMAPQGTRYEVRRET